MAYLKYCLIKATAMVICISSAARGMPPQLEAVNDFIAGQKELAGGYYSFITVIDPSLNAILVWYKPIGNLYERRGTLNYVSFSPDGTRRLAEHVVLEDAWGLSPVDGESRIIADKGGNVHLVTRDDRRSDYHKLLQTYVMIDSLGNLKKKIEFDKSFIPSCIRILEDGTLLVHGGFGQLNQPDSELVLLLRKDADKFESFCVETPDLGFKTTNIRAQIYALGDGNILLLKSFSSRYIGKAIVRKTIMSVSSRVIIDAELLDLREAASIFYYNKPKDISYEYNRIFPVGDTIAYLCGLRCLADPAVPMDSMCVIFFDSHGKLIRPKSVESYPIETGVLTTFEKNDFLIRNNRNAFGDYLPIEGNSLSLSGLMSLRYFPRIIIDTGME